MKTGKGNVFLGGNKPRWRPKPPKVRSLVGGLATGFKLTIYDNRDGAAQDAVMARIIFTCDANEEAEAIAHSPAFAHAAASITLPDGRSICADVPTVRLSHCEEHEGRTYERACDESLANGRLHDGDPAMLVLVVPTKEAKLVSYRWQDVIGLPKRLS